MDGDKARSQFIEENQDTSLDLRGYRLKVKRPPPGIASPHLKAVLPVPKYLSNRIVSIPAGLLFDPRLQAAPSALIVYSLMLAFAGKKRVCYPSQTRLAKHAGLERQATNKAVSLLVLLGYLIPVEQTRDLPTKAYYLPWFPDDGAEKELKAAADRWGKLSASALSNSREFRTNARGLRQGIRKRYTPTADMSHAEQLQRAIKRGLLIEMDETLIALTKQATALRWPWIVYKALQAELRANGWGSDAKYVKAALAAMIQGWISQCKAKGLPVPTE